MPQQLPPSAPSTMREACHHPLHTAARAGDILSLQEILAGGAHPVDAWDAEGNTALMLACETGHEDAVRLLLAAGADASWRRTDGYTALNLAVENGHEGMVRLLLASRGGRRAISLGNRSASGAFTPSPLSFSAGVGDTALTQLLLEAGAHVEGSANDSWSPLSVAAMWGQPQTAALLLAAGADIEATDAQGGTPLYLAAQEGQAGMVRWLAERGARVNMADEDGMTPLHAAAIFCSERSAQQAIISSDFGAHPPHRGAVLADDADPTATLCSLLKLGANPHARDAKGRTPLHYAVLRDNRDAVSALLAAGAVADDVSPEDGTTPLTGAAANGRCELFEQLLALGADPHRRRSDGRSMLHAACRAGDIGIIRRLLELGLSPDARDEQGRSVLHYAAGRCSFDVFHLLLSHSRSEDWERPSAGGRTLLHQAACNESPETLAFLLQRGANPLAEDENGVQPLYLAADRNPESVRLLLAAGADANHPGYEGRLPLQESIGAATCENLQLLLAAGARINAQDRECACSALHTAAFSQTADMAEALLAAGADLTLRDNGGLTPLLAAITTEKEDIIRCLIDHGGSLHDTTPEGRNALTQAVDWDCAEAVSLLLQAGADPNAPDAGGKLPLHLAIEEAELPCLLALIEGGANPDAADPKTGETALMTALRLGNRAASIALLACGASAIVADHKGMTALHHASQHNRLEIIPALLHAGGNPAALNEAGQTALELARSATMRKLLSRG